jgi:hypothetical protein
MPKYIYSYPLALREIDDELPFFNSNPALTLQQNRVNAVYHLAISINHLRDQAVPDAYIPRFLRSVYYRISVDLQEKIWNSMKDDTSKFDDFPPKEEVFSYPYQSGSAL